MSTYTNVNLTAEVLTQRMPLSDAFNRSQGAVARHGVHHGMGLSWGAMTGQLGKVSTRYLRVGMGKASIAVVQDSELSAQDQTLVAAELAVDVDIDLEALSSPILEADAASYYVVLKVDYARPTVNNFTGLVSNPGRSNAQILFVEVVGGTDPTLGWPFPGLVLGKLCRASRYLEFVANSELSMSDIASESFGADVPNVTKDDPALAVYPLRTQCLAAYYNLDKRVRIRGLRDASAVNSTVMPLSGITSSVATSVGAVNSWKRTINWLSTAATTVYVTDGIWKDVSHFELSDSRFADNVQLAFHRTPGHGMVQALANDSPASLVDEVTIRGFTDYGMRMMVLDFKGTVFEKDLAIDLVLDFTGQPKDCTFRLFVKNLNVKGVLTINYGQSWLGMAGGTQGTMQFENCVVYGDMQIRPWPQVNGLNADSSVTPAGSPAFPSWCNTVQFYLNNAGNIIFSGFTMGAIPNNGPDVLNYWRRNLTAGSTAWTKGVLIPCYLHNASSGSGEYTMDNPWLMDGAEGALTFLHSTVPQNYLLGESLHAVTGLQAPKGYIRVKMLACAWVKTRGTDVGPDWNLISKPGLRACADDIFLLSLMQSGLYQIFKAQALTADGTLAGASLDVTGAALIGTTLDAGGDISGPNVITEFDVHADQDVHAERDVVADRYLVSTGKAFLNALVNRIAGFDTGITGTELEVLSGGVASFADALHTHLLNRPYMDANGLLVPVGTIIPYAGGDVHLYPPPKGLNGWLLCDGQAVSRTTYAALFAVISTYHGYVTSADFCVPDLRGMFLRGVNTTSSSRTDAYKDPDAETRSAFTPAGGSAGSPGDHVGSVQAGMVQSHTHGIPSSTYASNGSSNLQAVNYDETDHTSRASGGNETRPNNLYVYFLIKY